MFLAYMYYIFSLRCILGFLKGITPTNSDKIQVKEFTLMELKKPATYGAAYLGAKKANVNVQVRLSSSFLKFITR